VALPRWLGHAQTMVDLRFRITSITSADGQEATLPQAGVTCIVGGNNAGKSRLLRDIVTSVSGSSQNYEDVVTLSHLELNKDSFSENELRMWLEGRFGPADERGVIPSWGSVTSNMSIVLGMAALGNLSALSNYFLRYVAASESVNFASGEYLPMGGDWGPFYKMYKDGSIVGQLSELSQTYFGDGLTYDRVNLNPRLRFGQIDRGIEIPRIDKPTLEYSAPWISR
jgi:hypothetical protein